MSNISASGADNSFFSDFINGFMIAFNIGFDIGYVFMPLVGYISQYLKFKKLNSSVGFSKFISLIFLISFILRVFFWIGKRFQIIILFQTLVGIIMQLVLLKACVELNPEYKSKKESDYFKLSEFWNWPKFTDYFYFIFFIIIFINSLSLSIGYDNIGYIESLGGISSFIESLVGVPQIIEFYQKKIAQAFSYTLIISWILGDSTKLFYFLNSSAPLQLIIMAIVQFVIDIIIIIQIIYYNRINKRNSIQIENSFNQIR